MARSTICKLRLQHAHRKAKAAPPDASMQLRRASRWPRCSEDGNGVTRTIRCQVLSEDVRNELDRRVIMHAHAHNLVLVMYQEMKAIVWRKEPLEALDLESKGNFSLGMYFAVAMRYYLLERKLPEFSRDQLQELQVLFSDNPHQTAIQDRNFSLVQPSAQVDAFYGGVAERFKNIMATFNPEKSRLDRVVFDKESWNKAKAALWNARLEMVEQAVSIFMPRLARPDGERRTHPPRSWEEFRQRDYTVMLRYYVHTLKHLKALDKKHPAKYVDPRTADKHDVFSLPVGFGYMFLNDAKRKDTTIIGEKRRWRRTIDGDTHTYTHTHTHTHTLSLN
jgi:hypothetical protein